jgi:glycyl-tRNA synthetase beta chain
MPVAVGLDAAGNATPALLKKLAAMGATRRRCQPAPRKRRQGRHPVLRQRGQGATLAEGLQKALEAALAALPIPKVMTTSCRMAGAASTLCARRTSLVALHGADVVPLAMLGLTSGRETHGHRFEAAVDPVVFAKDADEYASKLEARVP